MVKKKNEKYDIVFIDPPFEKKLINLTSYLLEKNEWLNKKSYIYIEYKKKTKIKIPSSWFLYRNKISGTVNYSIFLKK